MICEEEARFAIKDTKDYYCEECATDQFGDISYLIPIEKHNKREKSDALNLEEEQKLSEK